MATEHAGQHSAGDGEIGCAEKDPGDSNRTVGRKSGEDARNRMTGPGFVFEKDSNDALDHEIRAVQQAPNHKCPGSAVPKSTEKHDDDKIQGHSNWPDLIAAERNVEVIAQKSGKRNVPAPPKIRE